MEKIIEEQLQFEEMELQKEQEQPGMDIVEEDVGGVDSIPQRHEPADKRRKLRIIP